MCSLIGEPREVELKKPRIGWRWFSTNEEGRLAPLIQKWQYPRTYRVGQEYASNCYRYDHLYPTAWCTCGFHVFDTYDNAMKFRPHSSLGYGRPLLRRVEMWGAAIEYYNGYRVEKMRVLRKLGRRKKRAKRRSA